MSVGVYILKLEREYEALKEQQKADPGNYSLFLKVEALADMIIDERDKYTKIDRRING